MNTHTILAFATVAGLSIATSGSAVLLTLRNGASLGFRLVAWSALGGMCCILFVCCSNTWFGRDAQIVGASVRYRQTDWRVLPFLHWTSAFIRTCNRHTINSNDETLQQDRELCAAMMANPRQDEGS